MEIVGGLLMAVFLLGALLRRRATRRRRPKVVPTTPTPPSPTAPVETSAPKPEKPRSRLTTLALFLLSVVVILWLFGTLLSYLGSKVKSAKDWVETTADTALKEAYEREYGDEEPTEVPLEEPPPSVTGTQVLEWMNEHRADDWEQSALRAYSYKASWQPGERGYDVLPMNLGLLKGGLLQVQTFAGREQLGTAIEAYVFDQRDPTRQVVHGGGGQVRTVDNSVLGVGVRPTSFGGGAVNLAMDFTVTPSKGSGLRLGWHRQVVPDLAVLDGTTTVNFGLLPLVLDGKEVAWEAQINFVPLDLPGSTRVHALKVSPDYYLSHWHEVAINFLEWSLPAGPSKIRADSHTFSSEDVRKFLPGMNSVGVSLRVQGPFIVYVVVLFPEVPDPL